MQLNKVLLIMYNTYHSTTYPLSNPLSNNIIYIVRCTVYVFPRGSCDCRYPEPLWQASPSSYWCPEARPGQHDHGAQPDHRAGENRNVYWHNCKMWQSVIPISLVLHSVFEPLIYCSRLLYKCVNVWLHMQSVKWLPVVYQQQSW